MDAIIQNCFYPIDHFQRICVLIYSLSCDSLYVVTFKPPAKVTVTQAKG